MKIRAKLTSLVLGVAVCFGLAVAAYSLFLAPVDAMEAERASLSSISVSLDRQQTALNRLTLDYFNQARDAFLSSCEGAAEAVAGLDRVVALASASAEVREAIQIMRSLHELNAERQRAVEEDLARLEADGKDLFVFTGFMKLGDFYSKEAKAASRERVAAARERYAAFLQDLNIMNDGIEGAKQTVTAQFEAIDGVILAYRSRAARVALAIIGSIVAATIIIALLVARGIGRAIVEIERNIATMREGDLTERSGVVTRDEIGSLARKFNAFQDGLAASVRRIAGISKENLEVKGLLLDAVAALGDSQSGIESGSCSIERRIGAMREMAVASDESVGKIARDIDALDRMIDDENAMVGRSSAAVAQMTAAIEEIGRSAERNRDAARRLLSEAESGDLVLRAFAEKYREIPKSIGAIDEMTSALRKVASGTRLLAMNAAIEAARAGEHGKGFAVVAAEINELSETANRSAKAIALSAKSIMGSIDVAAEASAGIGRSFGGISERIVEISKSIGEVGAGIDEMRRGSGQILQAMEALRGRSVSVRGSSSAIMGEAGTIRSLMGSLRDSAAEIQADISSISAGTARAGEILRSVSAHSEFVGDGSVKIEDEIGRFRIADPDGGAGASIPA